MTFQPLAIADIMKLTGRGSASLNWTVYLSGAVISLTALNRMLRAMLMPGGGLAMRSKVALMSSAVSSAPSWNCTPFRCTHGHAHAQHAAPLRVRLGRGKLEFRAVEFERNVGRMTEAPAHSIGARRRGGAALHEIAAAPPRACGMRVGHDFPPLWPFSGMSTPCSEGLTRRQNVIEQPGRRRFNAGWFTPCRARSCPA